MYTKLDVKYLFFFLKSKSKFIESHGKGATVKGITINVIADLDIPLPTLQTQRKIAAALDVADTLIQKRKQAITKLDGLVESYFTEMFGFPTTNTKNLTKVPLGDICDIKLGKMLDSKKISGSTLYPYLGNKNV